MAFAAFCEVGRDMASFQSGGVNCCLLGAFPQDLGLATVIQHGVQGRVGFGLAQQTLGGCTERGEVGDFRQPNDTT